MATRSKYISRGWRLKKLFPKEDEVVDVKEMDCSIKFAAAKAFPSVVGILCRNIPYDMARIERHGRMFGLTKSAIKCGGGELVIWGSGIIYECYTDDETTFTAIIICPATLFFRTNSIQLSDIQVDVYLWDGTICQAQVIACDFHYNLAAVRIQTRCQLQTVTFRDLDDSVPIKPTPIQPEQAHHRPLLRPHSSKFHISRETHLITISRSLTPLNAHIIGSGVFSTLTGDVELDYSELYWVMKSNHPEKKGGAVINHLGEFIGLLFYNSPFLPINLVSTWWKNFKNYRQYHQPYLGMKLANLHATKSKYMSEILALFPDVTGGVVVTEAAEDEPAYSSGIRRRDVIIKCDGKLVCTSLELFEILWNKVGIQYVVELDVLRPENGKSLKLSLKVKQTPPDKIYQWKRPCCYVL